ncbi:hypothetical protein BGK67_02980 [Streptomyces subrutilus]|uniref:Uncharacterized protein n=1 Tax=Streptomyces subrutilus TaxID=36818 RepID=A0A1E5PLQ5_9ACTN|nr:hypothetical protein BGK67_02980 [Streptomyces subrutilus]
MTMTMTITPRSVRHQGTEHGQQLRRLSVLTLGVVAGPRPLGQLALRQPLGLEPLRGLTRQQPEAREAVRQGDGAQGVRIRVRALAVGDEAGRPRFGRPRFRVVRGRGLYPRDSGDQRGRADDDPATLALPPRGRGRVVARPSAQNTSAPVRILFQENGAAVAGVWVMSTSTPGPEAGRRSAGGRGGSVVE